VLLAVLADDTRYEVSALAAVRTTHKIIPSDILRACSPATWPKSWPFR
jgi:hypothetical protein